MKKIFYMCMVCGLLLQGCGLKSGYKDSLDKKVYIGE